MNEIQNMKKKKETQTVVIALIVDIATEKKEINVKYCVR
jgi:hypothetical protein